MNNLIRATAATRPVKGYVNAVLAHRRLKMRLDAKEALLRPLRNRVSAANAEVLRRQMKLTGGQFAAAERLLAAAPHGE